MSTVNDLNDTITSYMLGDVDGGAVSRAQGAHLSAWVAAVEQLKALKTKHGRDWERVHIDADEILLAQVPAEVREAYLELVAFAEIHGWWACS